MVMDLYQLVRDLINEAKEQKNLELVDKLIELKLAISEIQDENIELRKRLEQQKKIERHSEGTYITLKDDNLKIHYCATCWGTSQKLIQLASSTGNCPICYNNWIAATKGKC